MTDDYDEEREREREREREYVRFFLCGFDCFIRSSRAALVLAKANPCIDSFSFYKTRKSTQPQLDLNTHACNY